MRRRGHQQERLRLLGGLSAVAVVAFGCDGEEAPTVPKSRAAAVTATPKPSAAPAPAPVASALPTEKSQRKDPLCQGQLEGKGEAMPSVGISRAGAPLPPEDVEVGGGGWTWINFWAAWCVPCREEIPRLRSWESKLGPKLRVTFVSLDDDERQLQDFLKAQPENGVRATYWLKDGKEREEWLAEAKVEIDPELPAHLLVDPAGRVRCSVSGAVEDGDFARVREIVGG